MASQSTVSPNATVMTHALLAHGRCATTARCSGQQRTRCVDLRHGLVSVRGSSGPATSPTTPHRPHLADRPRIDESRRRPTELDRQAPAQGQHSQRPPSPHESGRAHSPSSRMPVFGHIPTPSRPEPNAERRVGLRRVTTTHGSAGSVNRFRYLHSEVAHPEIRLPRVVLALQSANVGLDLLAIGEFPERQHDDRSSVRWAQFVLDAKRPCQPDGRGARVSIG